MILLLSNIILMGLRWLCQNMRYQHYANALQKMLQHKGVFVERCSSKNQSSKISAMKLLSSSSSFKGLNEILLEDPYLKIHQMNSMVEIDLTNWITYKGKPKCLPEAKVLVEVRALPPQESTAREPLSLESLHMLTCGTAVAWTVEDPLGFILACDMTGVVNLIEAFGQDGVMVDGFEITGLATVKTKSWPQHLVANEEDVLRVSPGILKKIKDKNVNCPINPPNPSNNPIEISVKFVGEKDNSNGEKDNSSSSVSNATNMANESSASSDTLTSSSKTMTASKGSSEPHETENINSKPPNILVYCGVKDTARKFVEAERSLHSCVNTDAYAIYHLTHDNLITSPWQRNCAALVVTSCARLRSDAEDLIHNFVKSSKGNLLSFNSSIDKQFLVNTKHNDDKQSERLITFSFKDWASVSSVSGPSTYSGTGPAQMVIPLETPTGRLTGEKHLSQQEKDISHSSSNGASENTESRNVISESDEGEALVVKVSPDGEGTAILSQLLLERDPASFAIDDKSFTALKKSNTERLAVLKELLGMLGIDTNPGPVPNLTCCHLVAWRSGLKESLLGSFKHRLNQDNVLKSRVMSLKFHASPDDETDIQPSLLPVTTNVSSDVEVEFFDLQAYWKNLKTMSLGQVVLYTDVISSTMTVFDSLLFSIPNGMGPVAIAGRQTSGKGRGGNAWLSPVGCAMFTLPMKFSLDSELGSHISFLQHLVAVSVVQSVVTLPGYEAVNIRLKWPNDIYFGREIKLGGVLVKSTLMDNFVYATIGCGFNVSNSNPTMCINDIIQQHNSSNPGFPPLPPLSAGQLLARTLNSLESLAEDFQRNGQSNFCQLYYKHWLHGGTRVKVDLDTQTDGEIVGLDKYGFLSLRTEDGSLLSVQPDGNSFDMLHNLIHFKTQ